VTLFTYKTSGAPGILDHFWTTGDDAMQNYANGIQLEVAYQFDGEQTPSIVFEPAMMAGQGHAVAEYRNISMAGQERVGLYHAGSKMGKRGERSAWWNYFKLPFDDSVLVKLSAVQSELPGAAVANKSACMHVYAVVRGFEDTAGAGVTLTSGAKLPPSAKMVLQKTTGAFHELSLVPLVNVTAGTRGLLFMHTLAVSTLPPSPWAHWVEGCFHLFQTASTPWPGMIDGTGWEDFYDSSYGFTKDKQNCTKAGYCEEGVLFQNGDSGITHFATDRKVERASTYKFFDHEAFGFSDGGSLQWSIGKQQAGGHVHPTPPPATPTTSGKAEPGGVCALIRLAVRTAVSRLQ
jgi:hypothetical protein